MSLTVTDIVDLLHQSDELSAELAAFLALHPYDKSARITSSRTLCGVSFEHAESVRVLISTGNFTSSLGVLRMQYEALVKAVWALYAASDNMIDKLQSELNAETAKWADKVPLLNEILVELEGKAPPQAIGPLLEFKEYSWKPLSSYIHGGIHAITRHGKGYPTELLSQAVRSSNGLQVMAGMMLVILSGDSRQQGKIPGIQQRFGDCCPNLAPHNAALQESR
jgi:hypothetical protein